MAEWRIFVVEDEEPLNRNIVLSLRKDGYIVQGVMNVADAVRTLWSGEYDVVVCDLKAQGADGFELLQWLRSYRPNTRMIMAGGFGSASTRTQALEGGAAGYLERPLDLHLLKEELRRLLQQTGFSANLDSFDLLDVVQIVTMSRRNIALVVNTGLEEHGILRFQGGELIWAEYGTLRGEEAFFALAAHKNGTIVHQPWNEQIRPNVTQPLSRLIFQTLQYRTKYADVQQPSAELKAVATAPLHAGQEDDSPFVFVAEQKGQESGVNQEAAASGINGPAKEWWQQTGKVPSIDNGATGSGRTVAPDVSTGHTASSSANIVPSTVRKTPAGQRSDLPSWLTDQPTIADMPAVRPSSLTGSAQLPVTPVAKPVPAEWKAPPSTTKTTGPIGRKETTGPQKSLSTDTRVRPASSPEWQPAERQAPLRSGPLQSLAMSPKTGDTPLPEKVQESDQRFARGTTGQQLAAKHNYSAVVSALQTLAYSIPGFIAAAVVSIDGQPIAQVAVDGLDISKVCRNFSNILKSVLQSLDQGAWGDYEDTVITSVDRHILMRVVSNEKTAFQVLITTREADPIESLEVMANVEGAINAALR